MGTICSINTRPNTWPAFTTEAKLKPEFGTDPLYVIHYGSLDDDPVGVSDLTMLMRKSIYDKLLSGEYVVSPDSNRVNRLIVLDRDGKTVQPLSDTLY